MVWPLMSFGDLRRLANWFAAQPRVAVQIDRLVEKLGATAVPLLGRELRGREPRRRAAARDALGKLAASATAELRARVIAELRAIVQSGCEDDAKLAAAGLLAELGERAAARLRDPDAIKRRSAAALAIELDSAADVAAAAELIVRQLDPNEVVRMVETLAAANPSAAHRLATELRGRLDLAIEVRDQLGDLVASTSLDGAGLPADGSATEGRRGSISDRAPRRIARTAQVAVLVDAAARLVVIAARKVSGERRWRRWAVLIGAHGRIDDCIHDDHAGSDGDSAPLIASLCADGYRVASTDLDHARGVVAAAARRSSEMPDQLTSSYYLGRDLLELGDAHVGHAHRVHSPIGRATELLADGERARALELLLRCDASSPDVVAAHAACLLADHRAADAVPLLERALDVEPHWPLHHWNLATALHQLGDTAGCHRALARFVATSATPTGLYGDPDQPARVALAERLLSELERTARLAGTKLARPRNKRSRSKPRAS